MVKKTKEPQAIFEVYDCSTANHAYFSSRKLAEQFVTNCKSDPQELQIYTHYLDPLEWE